MRRRKDKPIPLELDILRATRRLADRGITRFHGHLLAKELSTGKYDARKLVGYGTLYKALKRLQTNGFLESEWEDPAVAAEHARPRRRLYTIRQERVEAMPSDLIRALTAVEESTS